MCAHGLTESNLLRLAASGDQLAIEQLVQLHRDRLKRMIRARLDPRLMKRLDESDVVQEVQIEVVERLPEYLAKQEVPFFNWLRFLARQKVNEVMRRNMGAQSRDVRREQSHWNDQLDSSITLMAFLSEQVESPSSILSRQELRDLLMKTIEGLPEIDREILNLRHVEQLSTLEAAVELDISENTCRQRHIRALKRLKDVLEANGIHWDGSR